jgi:hypothetical protein
MAGVFEVELEAARMTVFAPTRPTVSHFYKYKGPERLDWLEPVILRHEIYIPSVAQLNDPIDCRPKIAPMSEEEEAARQHRERSSPSGLSAEFHSYRQSLKLYGSTS